MAAEDRTVRESVVEKYLVSRLRSLSRQYPYFLKVVVKKIGGPGWRGWPDRMVLFDGAVTHWLEVKRPKGGRFEPLQLRCHRNLRSMGFVVRVVNTKALVDAYVDELVRLGPSGLNVVGEPLCPKPPKSSARTGTTATSPATRKRRLISSLTSLDAMV